MTPLTGATRFVTVLKTDPRFDVAVEDLGESLPCTFNTATMRIDNRTGKPLRAVVSVTAFQPGRGKLASRDSNAVLAPGETRLTLSYFFMDAGDARLLVEVGDMREPSATKVGGSLVVDMGGISGFAAETNLTVPRLHDAS
jgi:hypothetical protein